MSALGTVVRSGVGRRRVQTTVIGISTLISVTASILGGSLLVASDAPFDNSFADQNGAHLSARFDGDKVTSAQLAESADTEAVTQAAGPFPILTATAKSSTDFAQPLTIVGRPESDSTVDSLTLTDGVWADGPGELVLSAGAEFYAPIGTELEFPDAAGSPRFTIVGLARSVSGTADAWVSPSGLDSLSDTETGPDYQMLYRLADFGTAADITAGEAAIAAAVPAEALTGSQSWLSIKAEAGRETAVFVPFLLAFGVLGLAMSVLIVGNVVAGAVSSGTRRIGILKAIGFTPAQVVRAYIGQALIPASVATALGAIAGNLLGAPLMADTAQAHGTTALAISPWVNAAVIAGALAIVTATAWACAWRAGRQRTVEAIAVGRTPRPGRGQWAARLVGRIPLSRPMSLGLARPFARPGRASLMVGAVLFGSIAVTFAVGLGSSLNEVMIARDHNNADVNLVPAFPEDGPPPQEPIDIPVGDTAAITAALDAQPGTKAYFSTSRSQASIAGHRGSVEVTTFSGDAGWAGYQLIDGEWFDGPGEAVIPTALLAATGTEVGDTITVEFHQTAVRVRVVGEVFEPRYDGMVVLTDAATYTRAGVDLPVTDYRIAVKPGTDVSQYIDALNSAVASLKLEAEPVERGSSGSVTVLNALTVALTLLLVAVAGLGVLNGVVLDTRERIHDIGVYKALGMVPRQTITMVIASTVMIGLAGGALGVPIGMVVHSLVVPAMGSGSGLTLPESAVSGIYPLSVSIPLGLSGLVIAVLGALLPSSWAAKTRTITALRTE